MSEEFENEVRVFTLKTHQMFSVHTAPEKFDNLTITVHFRFFFLGKLGKGNHVIIVTIIVFRQHKNVKPALSHSFGLKSAFEKLRFCDGLVWTVGLVGETKLRFKFLRCIDQYFFLVASSFASQSSNKETRGY